MNTSFNKYFLLSQDDGQRQRIWKRMVSKGRGARDQIKNSEIDSYVDLDCGINVFKKISYRE